MLKEWRNVSYCKCYEYGAWKLAEVLEYAFCIFMGTFC